MSRFLRLGVLRLACVLLFAAWLASCGSPLKPVTGVSASGVRYTGALSVVTLQLTGDALTASGMRVYANGTPCSNDNSRSETSRVAYCFITVPTTLEVKVVVHNSSSEEVYKTTFTAPAPQVTFDTSMGSFVVELNPALAPLSVNNFLSYVNKSPSFYNDTIFHRVIKGFVVQGGGFNTGMVQKTKDDGLGDPIVLESNNGLTNDRGTVAMARTSDANSATSQFFVNLVDNTSLNYASEASPGYAVFGKVVSGLDVIDAIATQNTGTVSGNNDVPVTDITVNSASQTQ